MSEDIRDTVNMAWLKATYLAGLDTTDADGNDFADTVYTHAIESAIEEVETDLAGVGLKGIATDTYRRDVMANDLSGHYLLRLPQRPVRTVTALRLRLGNDAIAATLSPSWAFIRANGKLGQVQIVPTQTTVSAMLPSALGMGIAGGLANHAPGILEVVYTYGFDDTFPMPKMFHELVGLKASMLALDTMGDLVGGGPGIASGSTSIDGVSTSFGSTSSPENSGYSARIKSYEKRYDTLRSIVLRAWRPTQVGAV